VKVIEIVGNYDKRESKCPMVKLKSDSAILKDGKPFFIPDFAGRFTARPSIVVRIHRLGKNISRKFASRYYDAVTMGLAVQAEDMKDKIAGGSGCALADAFDGAAIIGDFVPVDEIGNISGLKLTMKVAGNEDIVTCADEMVMSIDEQIEYVSKYFTLKIGDILFTGYGNECHLMNIDEVITGELDEKQVLSLRVK
jgi:2-keto-4-pentenoate hydratase/2-oxohepta-3-ene-1,7-dioic acid hydratase in catechol pathway